MGHPFSCQKKSNINILLSTDTTIDLHLIVQTIHIVYTKNSEDSEQDEGGILKRCLLFYFSIITIIYSFTILKN